MSGGDAAAPNPGVDEQRRCDRPFYAKGEGKEALRHGRVIQARGKQ